MSLSATELRQIDALFAPRDADANAFASFRARFPGLSLTRCDISDLSAENPFREYPRFNLYLVDGADHCWRFTADPARATGIVVAQCKAPA
jgi:hypothetical protein